MAFASMSQQLLSQLLTLSEINEVLLLRLLDLEERLREVERNIEDSKSVFDSDVDSMLADADERLLRLQDLLTMATPTGKPRVQERVSSSVSPAKFASDHSDDHIDDAGEQPFMDDFSPCENAA